MSEKKTIPKTIDVQEARSQLWNRGILHWKLEPHQKDLYDFFNQPDQKIIVCNSSRRIGKTFVLTLIALEQCIRKENTIIKFVMPEQKMAKTILRPIIRDLTIDCPAKIKPEFKSQENIFVFKNGSEIQIAGTDNQNHEKIRGGAASICIVDEAGFCSDLGYVVRSILLPTTATTRGRILLASTPPPNGDHDFIKFIERAQQKGTYKRITFYDAVDSCAKIGSNRLTLDMIEEFAEEYPKGKEDIEFRREYMCELVTSTDRAVIPEFVEAKDDVVIDWPRPAFYDAYVGIDVGFRDLTAILFGYYDFLNGVFVIEDEIVDKGMTTDVIADKIKKKESELFIDRLSGEVKPPYLRISDNNNLILIHDLIRLHSLNVIPSQKSEKNSSINQLRIMIQNRKLIIHPRCVHTISHLQFAIWNKTRTDFMRSTDKGHYDCVDALLYLVRNVDFNKNPYPPGYQLTGTGDIFFKPGAKKFEKHEQWNKLIKPMIGKATKVLKRR